MVKECYTQALINKNPINQIKGLDLSFKVGLGPIHQHYRPLNYMYIDSQVKTQTFRVKNMINTVVSWEQLMLE